MQDEEDRDFGSDLSRPLLPPDSSELKELVSNAETRTVYTVLFEAGEDLTTMPELRQKVGTGNEHTDRRMRDLRQHFNIPARRTPSGEWGYRIEGWRPVSLQPRVKVSGRIEAQLYSKGARCKWCGKTSDDGIKLVVDHVVPLEWGGSNELDNLQLLCTEHNHAKQAHFSDFEKYGAAIKACINLPEAHLRIGELLKALIGQPVPVDLINLVCREENKGDPTKRLRELRLLGWVIEATRTKRGARTMSYYMLIHWEFWPTEGPRAAINRIEADRKRRKRLRDGDTSEPDERDEDDSDAA